LEVSNGVDVDPDVVSVKPYCRHGGSVGLQGVVSGRFASLICGVDGGTLVKRVIEGVLNGSESVDEYEEHVVMGFWNVGECGEHGSVGESDVANVKLGRVHGGHQGRRQTDWSGQQRCWQHVPCSGGQSLDWCVEGVAQTGVARVVGVGDTDGEEDSMGGVGVVGIVERDDPDEKGVVAGGSNVVDGRRDGLVADVVGNGRRVVDPTFEQRGLMVGVETEP
jgi:hypothetical protein